VWNCESTIIHWRTRVHDLFGRISYRWTPTKPLHTSVTVPSPCSFVYSLFLYLLLSHSLSLFSFLSSLSICTSLPIEPLSLYLLRSLYIPLLQCIFLSITITLYIPRDTLHTRSDGRMTRQTLWNRHFGVRHAFYPWCMCWSFGRQQKLTTGVSVKYNLRLQGTFAVGETRVML